MEPSTPFHTLVKLVDAEDLTKEQIPTFDLPLEFINVTSELEPQNLSAELYAPNNEVMFT